MLCVVCVGGNVWCCASSLCSLLLFSVSDSSSLLLLLLWSCVVVGAEGRAGSVGCSSLLPREVLGEVAAVTAARRNQLEASKKKRSLPQPPQLLQWWLETCLVEDVGEGHVELPDAKARGGAMLMTDVVVKKLFQMTVLKKKTWCRMMTSK